MDEHVFAKIIGDTKEAVLCAVAKFLYPRFAHAVDDVAQETYLRAYKSMVKGKFQGLSSIKTWLYAIAKNESLRMNKKLTQEEKKREKLAARYIESAPPVSEPPFDNALADMLPLIPEKFAQVVNLHLNGLNEKEISEQLAIPVGTVKSRLNRGKKTLAKMITKEGENER